MEEMKALAKEISDSGAEHIFGIPGSGASLSLLDALEGHGVRFHLTHFEGTGALMAGAVGHLSGRAGVSVSIKGPGLANMVPGLAACRLEAWPVVSLSEAYFPGTPESQAHKRMDHRGLTAAVTKGYGFLSKNGPSFQKMARWAEREVPAPVHLDFGETGLEVGTPVPQDGDRAEDDSCPGRILEMIGASERPLVLAGSLARRRNLSSHLNGLSVPVFSTAAAKGVVDETLAQSAGVYTGAGLEHTPEYSILPEADLVVGIGLRHNELLKVKPFHCKSVNLDPADGLLSSGFQFDEHLKAGDGALKKALSALSEKTWGLDEIESCLRRMRHKCLSGPFMPANAFEIVETHFDHQCRLVLDTGNFCTIGEHFWRVVKPGLYLAPGQGRYMGVGLPLALGASLYDPGIPTVAFLGDGGVGMFVAEIKLAVKEKLPLVVILVTDAYLGTIRMRSIKDRLTEKPVTIHQPSWIKVFEGFGVQSRLAESGEALKDCLTSWSPSEGPLFIEIPFDPERYQLMLRGIR